MRKIKNCEGAFAFIYIYGAGRFPRSGSWQLWMERLKTVS
jgi:hypothetical protein